MKKVNIVIISLSIIGLTGCGSSWVNLDNSKVSKNTINSALIKCQFEKKRKEANRYLAGSHSKNEDINKRMKQLHEQTYKSALNCMKNEGLKKQN